MKELEQVRKAGRGANHNGRTATVQARRSPPTEDVASQLAAELARRVHGEVRFDAGSRALYATDASNYRQTPIGVVLPRNWADVLETVAMARRYDVPVLPRGGGTSLAGQTCNTAVVIDMSKYMRGIVSIDPTQRQARVQPGVVLDDLRAAAEQHGLTFGPDPATHNRCTLGGMIGNNSCGVHSIMAGKTDDNIDELEIVTYDGVRMRVGATSDEELARLSGQGGRRGEIYTRLRGLVERYAPLIRERYPDIPRRVSGYNLPWLLPERGFHVARALVGSEGTCVTVLEAIVRLVHSPSARVLLVLGYSDLYAGCDQIPALLEHKPIGLEGFDARLIHELRKKYLLAREVELLPEAGPKDGGWLLLEFGADEPEEAKEQAGRLMAALQHGDNAPDMHLFTDKAQMAAIWRVREAGLGATAIVPGEAPAWPGWEDSAVPPNRMGAYLRDFRALLQDQGYRGSFYGHFGQGCLHTRIDFDLQTAGGIARFRSFLDAAAGLVLRYGGSLSGEHGDGQARAELLPRMFGLELIAAFREFKAIWDPQGKMNPGKLVDAYDVTENLRLGVTYDPPPVETHFKYRADDGSFANATLRCVGVGQCRRTEGGTMCPSYMVTHEEQHSTRGRARLLFEMLQGNPLHSGWRDRHVRSALDLCLACKGCKGDCPVNVDMATYKAEFLAHYYAGRLRPRAAYSMGLIYWWSGLAAHAPRLANSLAQGQLSGRLLKYVAGIAPERQLPAFAPKTFRQWYEKRGPRPASGARRGRVILWPDTFNNHFHPHTAQAATEVLEAAGYEVKIPPRPLCCGRPLYDWGMLDLAQRLLRQTLEVLRPEIEAGVPVVGLEPSCVAVFRDELVNLLPDDADAQRLSRQAFLLDEFLMEQAGGYQPPQLAGAASSPALVHVHCHHKAVLGVDAERALLEQMGLDYQLPDDGCCGMAGAFGFEAGEHYDMALRVGERTLLPAVREAPKQALIIADGFSCREQIAQATERRAMHPAEVLQAALHSSRSESTTEPASDYPERRHLPSARPATLPSGILPVALLAPVLLAVLLAIGVRRRRGT